MTSWPPKTWFEHPRLPKARFESTSVKALPTAGQYEVVGTLTIKGQKQTVTVPARFTEKAGQGVFEGKLTIQRGAFSLARGRGKRLTSLPMMWWCISSSLPNNPRLFIPLFLQPFEKENHASSDKTDRCPVPGWRFCNLGHCGPRDLRRR